MKQFLKDNWFNLVITLAILIVAIAVGYYFVFCLPKEKSQKEYLANQIKCQEAGIRFLERQKDESKEYLSSPEFKYNNKLNVCLYRNGYISNNYISSFIYDVYANKQIASWDRGLDKGVWIDLLGTNKEEFDRKYNELFKD